MPYIDYAEWFRREQARRGRDQVFSPSSTIRPIQRVDTPTSFEQIGGRAVEIGKDQAKQEIRNRVAEALAPSTAATTTSVIGPGIAVPAGYTAVGTAANGGTMIAPSSIAGYGAGASSLAPGTTAVGTSTTGATMTAPSSVAGSGAPAASTGSSAASAAGTAASIAGTVYGGYNLSRDINKRRGATATTQSGMQTGAAIGSFFGPKGALIGAGIGALVGAAAGTIWSPRPVNYERRRWDRLRNYYGFDMPKPDWVDTKDAALKAQDKTLAKDFVGYNEQGKWVNNKFVNSGKNQDLKPQDIYDFATNFETFGKEYQVLPTEKKLQMMDIAVKNNQVFERSGTVDIAWTPETYQQAASILYNDPNVQNWQANQPKIYQSPVYVPPWKRK